MNIFSPVTHFNIYPNLIQSSKRWRQNVFATLRKNFIFINDARTRKTVTTATPVVKTCYLGLYRRTRDGNSLWSIQMLQEKSRAIVAALGWNEKGNLRVSKCALRITGLLRSFVEGSGRMYRM